MRRSERDVPATRGDDAATVNALRPVLRAPHRQEVAQALAALAALFVRVGLRSEKALAPVHEHFLLPCHELRLRRQTLRLDKRRHARNVSRVAFYRALPIPRRI